MVKRVGSRRLAGAGRAKRECVRASMRCRKQTAGQGTQYLATRRACPQDAVSASIQLAWTHVQVYNRRLERMRRSQGRAKHQVSLAAAARRSVCGFFFPFSFRPGADRAFRVGGAGRGLG